MTPTLEVLKKRGLSYILYAAIPSDNGCHTFGRGYNKEGYGELQFREQGIKYNILAHRAMYMLIHNVQLTKEDVIMHSCDNPLCINSLHLVKGTHKDNVADRVKKDRSAKGLKNGRYVHGRYVKR